jgi:hypothetical protein
MNPNKIELPENLIKKIEAETNIFDNINGLIQGRNLIIEENKELKNRSVNASNSVKRSNVNTDNNNPVNVTVVEENDNKNYDEENSKQSI